jgi:peroxidase
MFPRQTGLFLSIALSGMAAAADRTIDGSGNSTGDRGAAIKPFSRIAPVAYADGTDTAVTGRPNPRDISNTVCVQGRSVPNLRGGSDFIWQWGQFIDHDVTLAELDHGEPLDIPVPDPLDPLYSAGFPFIPFERTEHEHDEFSVRQQVNRLTSFIDGSMVYGSDGGRAELLREKSGGRLRIEPDGCLPFNTTDEPNASIGLVPHDQLRIAGDVRCNEQPGLLALHTIFVREHNRLAAEIAAANPGWDDEQVYQRARKINGAIIQAITYHEWLPALLGPEAPDPAAFAYDSTTDPSILNEFSTGLFRLGHTLVSAKMMRVHDDNTPDAVPWAELRDAYFNPSPITTTPQSLEMIMKGMACQLHQNADPLIVDDLRNFLFGAPGSGGMDLAALNIQRGRDHGLPDYNTMRVAFGLPAVTALTEVCFDPQLLWTMGLAYPSLDQIDPWIGGLVEHHMPGAAVGPLMAAAFVEQFTRLAEGDAFFFLWDGDLSPAERTQIAATRLGEVIKRNSSISELQENVFFVPDPGPFRIKSMEKAGDGTVTLWFMAEPGYRYVVKYSDDLVHWEDDLGEGEMLSGDSVLLMRCDDTTAPVGGQRFYKVEKLGF